MTAGNSMYLPIEANILAVHIAKDVGVKERVIECGVKDRQFIRVAASDLDCVQACTPGSIGLACKRTKASRTVIFRRQICFGVSKADIGNAKTDRDNLMRAGIEKKRCRRCVVATYMAERLVEMCGKIEDIVVF